MPVMKTMDDFARECRERGVPEIDIEDYIELAQRRPTTKLIDVREKGEWLCGRLPRAINVSRGVLENSLGTIAYNGRITDHDLAQPIVFYCGCGDRSLLVTERAMEMGFENAFSLDGGFKEWAKSGLEIIVDKRFPW